MIGNEAIARGLVENCCSMALSYPGTPASEILPGVVKWKKELSLPIHTQWAVNEKIAFEIAYAGSIAGIRTAVSMKQVGHNARDPSHRLRTASCQKEDALGKLPERVSVRIQHPADLFPKGRNPVGVLSIYPPWKVNKVP